MMRRRLPAADAGDAQDCEKPVIVALNGTAAGGGSMFVLAADLVIAADNAKLIQVFVRRGLIPDGGVAYLLPRLVGCTRRRSSSSSATTSRRPTRARSASSTRSCPPPSCRRPRRSGPSGSRADRRRRSAGRRSCSTTRPSCRVATSSKKRRCSSSSTRHTSRLGRGRGVVPRTPRSRSGRAGELPTAHQGQDRGRRDRADRRSARGSPTPSSRSRARRSRSRSTTRASRRRRSTGSRRYTMEPNREVDVARAVGLGDITYFSQVGFGGGAGLRRRRAGRDGGRDRAVRRSRSRGGRASGPTPRAGRGRRPTARLADSGQWTRPFGILRPVDEIAMLTRRYMHEYGGTRDHLANVALAFRKHASAQPGRDDGSQAADARGLHERALDLRAAVPLRQLPRDRRRARGRDHESAERADDLQQPPACIHAFAQGLPPQHQTMTNYFTDDPLRGPAWTAAKRLWANADVGPADVQGRAALRRVQPAHPALARGLRLLRARRGRPVHRRRRDRVARRPAAGEHVAAAACRRRTCTASTSSSKACARSAARRRAQVANADVSLVTSGEGVPTSAILFTKDAA